MTLNALNLFGLFIIFLGLGLFLYTGLLGLYLRFHLQLFPKIHAKLAQLKLSIPEATMQTIKYPSELDPEIDSSEFCPKCQNILTSDGVQPVAVRFRSGRASDQMIYSCPHCGAKFAFFPVTTLQLFEVEPVEA